MFYQALSYQLTVESCEVTLNPTATGRTQIGMLLSMNVSPSSASSRG